MVAVSELASGPFTVADLEGMPDDGRRYELIDGELLVSPAPGFRHQKVVAKLIVALDTVCPKGMHVLSAPFGVRTSMHTELQPDVLVTRDEDVTEKYLPVAPLLAVEVLSPSTARSDLLKKKSAYEQMGVPSYWVVDPFDPSLWVFELDENGFYQTIADVARDKAFEATQPFSVRIVPDDLLDGLAIEQE